MTDTANKTPPAKPPTESTLKFLEALAESGEGIPAKSVAMLVAEVRRLRALQRQRKDRVTLDLPHEFLTLCFGDRVKPEVVLRGFIADLCDYSSCGATVRHLAQEYYQRCGYPACYVLATTDRDNP